MNHGTKIGRMRNWVAALAALASVLMVAPFAHALEGRGYGASVDEARQRAAADLVGTIQTRVLSVVESCTQVAGRRAEDCGSRVLKRTEANLPMLGLRYDSIPGDGERHGARAVLDPKTAVPLYRRKLADLLAEFDAAKNALPTVKDPRQRHAMLSEQLARLRAITDHRLVAVALGEPSEEAPATETALLREIEGLEQSVDSLALAARVLFHDVKGYLASLDPIVAPDSEETTTFGDALGKALRAEASGRGGKMLSGKAEYRVLPEGLVDVSLELLNVPEGDVAAVRTVRLLPAAYAGYEVNPRAPSFERLLREGAAESGALKVEVTTTKGGRDLLFRNGEPVTLLIRSNTAAFYYVVGHTMVDGQQFSYLLPLHGEPGGGGRPENWETDSAPFIQYIPPDKVNHHLPVANGGFVVQAPFGVEHIQVIAATRRPAGLPQRRWNRLSGYYEIVGSVGNVTQGLALTRGVKPKADKEVAVSEGTLSFTTMPR